MVNLIKNPDFSLGTTNWTFDTDGVGTFNIVNGLAEVKNTVLGTYRQLFQTGIPLQANTDYTLSFYASSSLGNDIRVDIIKHTTPFNNYGLSYMAPLTSTMQKFTVNFNTAILPSNVIDGRFRFWMPGIAVNEIVRIDNIVLDMTTIPTTNYRVLSTMNWTVWTDANLREWIDKSKVMGINVIALLMRKAWVNTYRNTSTDPLKGVMSYAASKGISFLMVLDHDEYGSRETMYSNIAAQTAFLIDMQWVIARYPELIGYEMEEPHRYGTDAATAPSVRAAYNAFFVNCKSLVPLGKIWSFNSASGSRTNMMLQGIDVDYINNNRLFDVLFVQTAGTTLSNFQSELNLNKNYFPNLQVIPICYGSSSTLMNSTDCQINPWGRPSCFNQAFFDQLKWVKSQGMPIKIFRSEFLKVRASMWPVDTTPGATCGDKVSYIIGTSTPPPCPIPICGFTIKEA